MILFRSVLQGIVRLRIYEQCCQRWWSPILLINCSVRSWGTAYSTCLQSSFSNISLTSPGSQLILQPFRRFTYVTAHSPTLPLLHLRQFILQPFFRFSYVTISSLKTLRWQQGSCTTPGEICLLCFVRTNCNWWMSWHVFFHYSMRTHYLLGFRKLSLIVSIVLLYLFFSAQKTPVTIHGGVYSKPVFLGEELLSQFSLTLFAWKWMSVLYTTAVVEE